MRCVCTDTIMRTHAIYIIHTNSQTLCVPYRYKCGTGIQHITGPQCRDFKGEKPRRTDVIDLRYQGASDNGSLLTCGGGSLLTCSRSPLSLILTWSTSLLTGSRSLLALSRSVLALGRSLLALTVPCAYRRAAITSLASGRAENCADAPTVTQRERARAEGRERQGGGGREREIQGRTHTHTHHTQHTQHT